MLSVKPVISTVRLGILLHEIGKLANRPVGTRPQIRATRFEQNVTQRQHHATVGLLRL